MQTVRLIGYGSSLGEWLTGYENLYSSQPYLPGNFNPQHAGTELSQFDSIKAADALAPCIARTSAAMILTM